MFRQCGAHVHVESDAKKRPRLGCPSEELQTQDLISLGAPLPCHLIPQETLFADKTHGKKTSWIG